MTTFESMPIDLTNQSAADDMVELGRDHCPVEPDNVIEKYSTLTTDRIMNLITACDGIADPHICDSIYDKEPLQREINRTVFEGNQLISRFYIDYGTEQGKKDGVQKYKTAEENAIWEFVNKTGAFALGATE